MAGSVNKVILIGNLGKDPEVRYIDEQTAVARFPMATSESYKDRQTGERKSITDWHNIVMWRGLAQVAEKYLKKGNKVYIEGKLKTRSWDDKEGNTRYTTEVVADNMTMLDRLSDQSDSSAPLPSGGGKKSGSDQMAETKSNYGSGADQNNDQEEDDLPF